MKTIAEVASRVYDLLDSEDVSYAHPGFVLVAVGSEAYWAFGNVNDTWQGEFMRLSDGTVLDTTDLGISRYDDRVEVISQAIVNFLTAWDEHR